MRDLSNALVLGSKNVGTFASDYFFPMTASKLYETWDLLLNGRKSGHGRSMSGGSIMGLNARSSRQIFVKFYFLELNTGQLFQIAF